MSEQFDEGAAILASYQRTIDKLKELLREARPHCVGQEKECCGCGVYTAAGGPPECCGEPVDLSDRIGLALTMLEPHEVSQG